MVTLGAVIIMMLHNKYNKLYKNIHLDDQLRQKEGETDKSEEDNREKIVAVGVCFMQPTCQKKSCHCMFMIEQCCGSSSVQTKD